MIQLRIPYDIGHPKRDDISDGPFVRARIVNCHENSAKSHVLRNSGHAQPRTKLRRIEEKHQTERSFEAGVSQQVGFSF